MFTSIVTIYLLIQGYVLWRYYQLLPKRFGLGKIAIVFAILVTISMPIALFYARELPLSVMRPLYLLGASWSVGLIYFLIPVVLLDLFRLLNYFTKWVSGQTLKKFRTNNGYLALILVVGYGGFFYMANQTYHNKVREEYYVNLGTEEVSRAALICDNSDVKQNFKAVMVSDIHIGHTIGKAELERWIAMINAEEPDYVFIAGDTIDNDVRPLYAANMQDSFQKIQAKNGVYAVPGNHEYITGIDKSLQFFKHAGVTLLRDEVVLLPDNIYLVGRDDRTNKNRMEMATLVQNLNPDIPVIAIDHQPMDVERVVASQIFMQLFGHTHQGQVWPYQYIAGSVNDLLHGYYQIGQTHFLVSSGIGIWGAKFRIGTQSEYYVMNFCQ